MQYLNKEKYEPEIFETTGVYKEYHQLCRDAISYLNRELSKIENIKHNILTRNGTDNKITFTIFSPKQRNLITLYPNKTLKIEIRDKTNTPNPFIKEVYSINDLEEVIGRIKHLFENL